MTADVLLRASFDRAAASYLDNADAPAELARWLALWLPGKRVGRVLEVGAGPGVFTRMLLPWEGNVVATDLSEAMCEAGRASLPGVCWRAMAAERPRPGPWNWILSSGMLQWAADPEAIFPAWRSELAPGGRVLGALFVEGSLPEWGDLAGDWAPLRWRSLESWRSAIARSGLRLIRDDRQVRVFRYPSARDFLRRLHAMGAAPRRRLGAGTLRRLLRDYDRRSGRRAGVDATWVFYRFEAAAG